jgi:drug/metabolite transporter (DMT)-like permease
MFSRLLLSIASVTASVGLLFLGMATSYSPQDDGMFNRGLILMIVGGIGTAAGIVLYRRTEAEEDRAAIAKYGPHAKES